MTDTRSTRMDPRRLRHAIRDLTLDWVLLHTRLPTPPRPDTVRRGSRTSYGHPAEWASDTAALIADMLGGWHDYLAEQRGETPPPADAGEQRRVAAAWTYLDPRCGYLAELVEAEALRELVDLHHRVRRVLGYTVPRVTLPVPCPRCGLRLLQRTVAVGDDRISCYNPDCDGYSVRDDQEGANYRWLVRVCLDSLIGGESDGGLRTSP